MVINLVHQYRLTGSIQVINCLHCVSVTISNESVAVLGELLMGTAEATVVRLAYKDVYQVRLTCRAVGETRVQLVVGNVPSSTNVNPVQSTAWVEVIV